MEVKVFRFGPGEMLILLIIVLLIFGPNQLPKLARGLGSAIKEFRKARREPADDRPSESTESKPDAPLALPESKPPENKPIQ
jgi:sec-independent protein translocase protein TatA